MVGDIVIVRFPYTDMRQGTVRPGLIVADVNYARQSDWIVCRITTERLQDSRQIPLYDTDLAAGRLDETSWVRPDRLMTMNESIFGNTIGRLTAAKLAEIPRRRPRLVLKNLRKVPSPTAPGSVLAGTAQFCPPGKPGCASVSIRGRCPGTSSPGPRRRQ